jgi:eukaryotic-like serine/threonine-protein kinase
VPPLDSLRAALADRYRLDRQLGQGGMATVYLAHDLKLDRDVALKVLRPELAAALGSDRFLREVEIAAKLVHPHILGLHDSGAVNGFFYYTMPFVEGESLRDRLTREKQLPLDEALRIAQEVADALGYAHAQGFVHRDIKPENILLAAGHAVVSDFGIARAISAAGGTRLTETGIAIGTPAYMSPEQALGGPDVDARSDLYSLGCVLYEMLSGEPPYTGPTAKAILAKKLNEPLPRISVLRDSVSPGVEAALNTALARTPADRWPTVAAFTHALVSTGGAAGAPVPSRAGRGPVRLELRRRLFATLAVGILIGAGALFAWRRGHVGGGSTTRRIAVLRFENTGDTAEEYLSDGLSDELRSSLTNVPGLAVKARGSSLHFTSGDVDLHEVGAKLDVESVLEAAVGERSQGIHLVAELVNVSDGTARWSRTFDGPRTAIGAIQDSIMRGVAGALGVKAESVPEVIATRDIQDSGDVAAYDLFLRGRNAIQHEDYRRAIRLFHQAVTRNPRFGRAWAALAGAYLNEPWTGAASRDSALARAAPCLDRAMALDSSLPEVITQRADFLETEFKFGDAERLIAPAVAAHPEDAGLRAEYASILYDLGRIPEAIAQARVGRRLDPLSPGAALVLQYFLYLGRDFRGAIAATQDVLELDPQNAVAWANMGSAYAFLGRPDSALAAVEKSVALDSTEFGMKVFLVWAYAGAGRWQDAARGRAAAERQLATANSPNLLRATLHLAYNQFDAAATDIERSVANLEPYLLYTGIPCDPSWDPLKANPRFVRAVHRYWPNLCPATSRWPIHDVPAGLVPPD